MIFLMAGLPGSGKSALARALAAQTGARVIGKDEIRQAIFLQGEIEYSSRQDDFCLQVMLELAAYLLRRNPTKIVILDGRTFSRRYQIENVVNAAESLHQPWRIIECVCSEEVARKRLQHEAAEGSHPAGNRNFQLYLDLRSRYEAIELPKIVIDSDRPLEACVKLALPAFP